MPKRCSWVSNSPLYEHYHDSEWGRPTYDDQQLFEMLMLELMQSGLSWLTVLKKRDALRTAFASFNWESLARFTEEDVARLKEMKAIIRHEGKIRAVLTNAAVARKLANEHGSFARFIWSFAPNKQDNLSEQAIALSKALKSAGMAFVGPTTCQSFMEAAGLVNSHEQDCYLYQPAK